MKAKSEIFANRQQLGSSRAKKTSVWKPANSMSVNIESRDLKEKSGTQSQQQREEHKYRAN